MKGVLRNRTAVTLVAAVILAGMLVGYAVLSRSDWPSTPLSPHRGDGAFRDKSGWRGPLFVEGYTISMDEFNFGQRHEAEHRLADLPDIEKTCGIYLAVPHVGGARRLPPEDEFDGELQFVLTDSDGNRLTSVSGR